MIQCLMCELILDVGRAKSKETRTDPSETPLVTDKNLGIHLSLWLLSGKPLIKSIEALFKPTR